VLSICCICAFPNARRKAVYAIADVGDWRQWGLAAMLVQTLSCLSAPLSFWLGYVLEQSLSIDNLFVFLLLFRLFRVPENRQPKVLFWGVTGAIGHARVRLSLPAWGLLARFHWIEYVFAAILGYAAIRMMIPSHDSEEEDAGVDWVANKVAAYQHEPPITSL
jgi:tellurite resistance protein TerC